MANPHPRSSRLRRGAALLVSLAPLAAANPAAARETSVVVLDQHYATHLEVKSTTQQTDPQGSTVLTVNDRVFDGDSTTSRNDRIEPHDLLYAQGSASFASVAASTGARFNFGLYGEIAASATASAESTLDFRPRSNAMTHFTFDLAGTGEANFSQGSISLLDLDNHRTLFDYGWDCCGFVGNVPWMNRAAVLAPSVRLLPSHRYELLMSVQTFADGDFEGVTIGMDGIAAFVRGPEDMVTAASVLSSDPAADDPVDVAAVPEPGTWASMGAGLVLLAAIRRRLRG